MNLFQTHTLQKVLSAYIALALLLSAAAPLAVLAEDVTPATPAPADTTPPPPAPDPEPAAPTPDPDPEPAAASESSSETETTSETTTTDDSAESSSEEETSVSESSENSSESSADESESGSESSEESTSTETTSESTHTESSSETEVTVETSEEETVTTTTYEPAASSTETETVSEASESTSASASSTATVIPADTIASSSATTTEAVSATGGGASTAVATTTDTTSSTTPNVGVSTVTDGDATVGTTTVVTNPDALTSTSTASSTIETGDGVASANILNMVNTNLVNSNGAVVFYNSNGGSSGSIDIRKQIEDPATSTCSLLGCAANTTNVQLDNNATIDNALVLNADTGNNLITDADSGEITTGSAYANANIINIANLNLIDSQYLLLTLNTFGNFDGDLVLPALAPMLNNAATTPALSLDNTALILNEVVTSATTGENNTEASDGSITTGDATTGVSLYNNINTNLVNDNVRVLFNIHGNWNGAVFGLPDDVNWYETEHGYMLDTKGSSSTDDVQPGVSSVTATNTAIINNRINVAANTGGNEINDANTALISTGNAYAGANILNVANANIVGQNWMLAIVNVFGDFNGNVSFGRPDIWIGGAATVPGKVKKDSIVNYTYTIRNNGDAPASNIVVTDDVSDHIEPTNIADDGTTVEDGTIIWHIDVLDPGESKTVSYEGRVMISTYETEITNTISSTLIEPDDNYSNNTEVVTFYTSGKSRKKSSDFTYFGEVSDDDDDEEEVAPSPSDGSPITALSLTRTPFISTITSDQPDATQTIKIVNDTNRPVYNALFLDQLYDVKNQLVHEERVELGTVLPFEEITFSYTLSFNHPATPPLQTYSFDSVFFDGTSEHVLSRNGYINHISDEPVRDEVGVEFALPGDIEITSTSSSVARVFGMSTSTATGTITHWPEPLVPLINAQVNDTSAGGGTPLAVSPTDLVFPILLLLLLLTYLYLKYKPELPSLQQVTTRLKFTLWMW